MEKLIRPYDKECMRMAMLKHEETFKEQVHELHRLYRIQKLLMKTIESGVRKGGNPLNLAGKIDRTDCTTREGVNLDRPTGDSNVKSEEMISTIEESQIELTLGPSSYNTSTSRSKKGDAQLSSSSFSSSSTGSTGNISRTKPGHIRSGAGLEEEQIMIKSAERLNHQPWIFQVLSLNST